MLDSIARHLIDSGKMMKEMPERNERPERQTMGRNSQPTGRMRFVHHDAPAQAPQPEADGEDAQPADEQAPGDPEGQE